MHNRCLCLHFFSISFSFFKFLLFFTILFEKHFASHIRCHILFISCFNHNCLFSCINFKIEIDECILLLLVVVMVCICCCYECVLNWFLFFLLSLVKLRNQIASSINIVKLSNTDVRMTTIVPTKSWTYLLLSLCLFLSLSSISVHLYFIHIA